MTVALGIDTSCYTTSVALASRCGVVASRRMLLTVEGGHCGTRQSEALFSHVQRLPGLIEDILQTDATVGCVCASEKPRDRADSYMPVFTAGSGFARAMAAALRVPFVATTHQQGHYRAALYQSGLPEGEALFVHLSGGTTEVLIARDGALSLLGGGDDLHAGQFVDRVGVALGLPFPAGPALEALARKGEARGAIPASVRGLTCSFSGAESCAQRLISSGMAREDVAAEVYSCLARTLAKLLGNASRETSLRRVLLAGGVAGSTLFRELLARRLERVANDIEPYWAKPERSGDNAVGVALIGADTLHTEGACNP